MSHTNKNTMKWGEQGLYNSLCVCSREDKHSQTFLDSMFPALFIFVGSPAAVFVFMCVFVSLVGHGCNGVLAKTQLKHWKLKHRVPLLYANHSSLSFPHCLFTIFVFSSWCYISLYLLLLPSLKPQSSHYSFDPRQSLSFLSCLSIACSS